MAIETLQAWMYCWWGLRDWQVMAHVAVLMIGENARLVLCRVNSAACIDVKRNRISHRLAHGEMRETEKWLPEGPVSIAITSGQLQ